MDDMRGLIEFSVVFGIPIFVLWGMIKNLCYPHSFSTPASSKTKRNSSVKAGPVDPFKGLLADPLPEGIRERIEQIRQKAAVLAHCSYPIGSKNQYIAKQVATQYLLDILRAFRDISKTVWNQPTENGRTPTQILVSQLEMIERGLTRIESERQKVKIDKLVSNELFLEEALQLNEPASELVLPGSSKTSNEVEYATIRR